MKDAFAIGGIAIAFLLFSTGAAWVVQGNGFFLYSFFAPKMEQVRRDVVETSKAYNDGMVMELRQMQFRYIQANDDQKAALADVIRHEYAAYSDDRLPSDLRLFMQQIRTN